MFEINISPWHRFKTVRLRKPHSSVPGALLGVDLCSGGGSVTPLTPYHPRPATRGNICHTNLNLEILHQNPLKFFQLFLVNRVFSLLLYPDYSPVSAPAQSSADPAISPPAELCPSRCEIMTRLMLRAADGPRPGPLIGQTPPALASHGLPATLHFVAAPKHSPLLV